MDTIISVRVEDRNGESIGSEALKLMQAIQEKIDLNLSTSELSRVNASSGIGLVSVSKETLDMIKESKEIARLSDGAFDISIGAVTKEWGFIDGNYRLPDKKDIERNLELVDYRLIKIDDSRVGLAKRGMCLDLGGIAKGYAVDCMYDFLKSRGVKRAIIDAGGTIKTIGPPLDKRGWKIGIRDPRDSKRVVGVLYLEPGLAVATSGDYERYFIKNGIRYHHILDPKTGYPVYKCRSVTIVSRSATEADALSTAIFVLGPQEGLRLAERLNVGVVIVDKNGDVIVSKNLKGRFFGE
ncbi:MAG: FAD:protein FMN transferase [bacterium]